MSHGSDGIVWVFLFLFLVVVVRVVTGVRRCLVIRARGRARAGAYNGTLVMGALFGGSRGHRASRCGGVLVKYVVD